MILYHDVPNLFQFLYGTIKRAYEVNNVIVWDHFNSYMVRLKEHEEIYVTFKDLDFNSYMVRLKELAKVIGVTSEEIFQFLYGTIKSSFSQPLLNPLHLFQFLYGTIKRRRVMRT